METVREQFNRLNRTGWPCAYSGDRESWLMVPVGQSRDSGCLEQSNFATAYKLLSDIDADNVAIESASHWAVGWVESLLINPDCPALVTEAESIEARLADYPVLNESDFSQREQEEADSVWQSCYSDKERIAYMRKNSSQFDFHNYADLIGCARGRYFAGYASELIGG